MLLRQLSFAGPQQLDVSYINLSSRLSLANSDETLYNTQYAGAGQDDATHSKYLVGMVAEVFFVFAERARCFLQLLRHGLFTEYQMYFYLLERSPSSLLSRLL